MNLAEYASYDGIALAKLVATHEVTPRELAETMLEAAASINPALNAVVATYPDRIPQQDAQAAGPFAGVPLFLKDVPMQAGVPSDMGCELARGYSLPHDQEVMRQFRRAGFVALGRTTTSELALAALTVNRLTGVTRNPWDPARSTAGSSGGAAALVAAGVLPIAHAADGGGSIRNPASFCGLVGLKPTRGRISAAPDWGEWMSGLSGHFVLTRTVRDCAACLDALGGPAPGDPYIIAPPERPYRAAIETPPRPLRIASNRTVWSGLKLDPEVALALETAGALLEQLGHLVDDAGPTFDYEGFLDAQITIWAAYTAQAVADIASRTGRTPSLSNLQSTTLALAEQGQRVSAVAFIEAELHYNLVTRQVASLFETYDILVTPTCTITPPTVDAVDLDRPEGGVADLFDHLAPIETFTALFNATGQPAISLPLGRSASGMPIGIQLVGRFGADDLLLALAAQLEAAAPWSCVPPLHVSRLAAGDT